MTRYTVSGHVSFIFIEDVAAGFVNISDNNSVNESIMSTSL